MENYISLVYKPLRDVQWCSKSSSYGRAKGMRGKRKWQHGAKRGTIPLAGAKAWRQLPGTKNEVADVYLKLNFFFKWGIKLKKT